VSRADDELTFPVAGLIGDVAGATRRFSIGPVDVDAGPGIELSRPVEGRLDLAHTNRGLLVRAQLRTALAETCSRCLRPVETPLEIAIDEEALPSVELASGQPLDVTTEPEVTRLTGDHELRLLPLVLDAIVMAEPIAPLCRPDCPGLCPICGLDLSEPGHEPHEVELDPRLEALRSFRVDESAETD
jgi:uncharacterized protein